ncbi:hypothetical protein PIB30_019739 [Stylosanthes scabra]|uniref:Uncharacterized protein n=1 Tax=Stylosanthes scabra TaxID=79078 RepID=A0ABU6W6D0_9FABA|nr:hypothetical protein [Stylosanthes scabra]
MMKDKAAEKPTRQPEFQNQWVEKSPGEVRKEHGKQGEKKSSQKRHSALTARPHAVLVRPRRSDDLTMKSASTAHPHPPDRAPALTPLLSKEVSVDRALARPRWCVRAIMSGTN